MLLQKIKIILAEHPEILETRANEFIETMISVNDSFCVIDTQINTVVIYSQHLTSLTIRYSIKIDSLCG
jgi:hypothetical protein